MALQNVRSLAAAQKLVQSLNSDTPTQNRNDITTVITEDNWPMMEQAGYVDFLISQAEKEFQDPSESPPWWNTGLELATALNGCVGVLRNGGESKALPKLRELILRKFLTRILSRDPKIGLSSLAPGIRAQELENPSPLGVFHCIDIASSLVSTIYLSLQYQPDAAFNKIFEKSEALEISFLVWYYALTAPDRNFAASLLVHIMHGDISHAEIAYRWFRYFSGEKIAGKCKEILQDESESSTREPVNLHLVNLMCNPANPGSRFGITFCTEGVHKVVLDVVNREMDRPDIDWGRMQHAGTILGRILEAEAGDSGETVIVIEYIQQLEILNLIARILLDESEVEDHAKAGFLRTFTMIAHCAGCTDSGCPCWGRSPPFVQCVKPALEKDQLWLKTLVKLRDAMKGKHGEELYTSRRDRMAAWLTMGLAVGLKEDHEHDGCSWRECESHTNMDEKNGSQLLKCSHCQVAKYCSEECQTEDWKDGHKVACNQVV